MAQAIDSDLHRDGARRAEQPVPPQGLTRPDGTAAASHVASHRGSNIAGGFSLLISALPEFAHVRMPRMPNADNVAPNVVPAPAPAPATIPALVAPPVAAPVAMTANAAAAMDWLAAAETRPPPAPPRVAARPVAPQSFRSPSMPARQSGLPARSSVPSRSNATPLAAVFGQLQATDSPGEDTGQPKLGLQSVFGLL